MLTKTEIELADSLEKIFNQCFTDSHATVLVNSGDEPIYLPADETNRYNRIVFAHGFWSSALHEIAHWCVAGPKRRTMVDYGYWYMPDGRDAVTQAEFERVEVKPQALEWIFTESLGKKFFLSTDNLSGQGAADLDGFKIKIREQVKFYLRDGLPVRARVFAQALRQYSRSIQSWNLFQDNVNKNVILPS